MTDKIMYLISATAIFLLGYLAGSHSSSTRPGAKTSHDLPVKAETLYQETSTPLAEQAPNSQTTNSVLSVEPITQLQGVRVAVIQPQVHIDIVQEWQHTLLTSQDIQAKLSAIYALSEPEYIEELVIGLGDNSEQVRRETMLALSAIQTDTAFRYISQTLYSDPAPENRALAIELLSQRLDLPISEHSLQHSQVNDRAPRVQHLAQQALKQKY